MVGNALALATHEPVRVAELSKLARAKRSGHVHLVLDDELEERGRTMKLSVIDGAPALAGALASNEVDVLVIGPPPATGTVPMSALGAELAPSLLAFFGRGGVLVAWTTPDRAADTQAFLDSAGVLDVASTGADAGDLQIVDWPDALAIGAGTPFTASGVHVTFELASPLPASTSIVVSTDAGEAVVIHRAFAPETP
jgi:hypothetical protein